MSTKVVVREGESIHEAYRRLKKRLSQECPDDQGRRRWWGAEWYEKPSERRRRKSWKMGYRTYCFSAGL